MCKLSNNDIQMWALDHVRSRKNERRREKKKERKEDESFASRVAQPRKHEEKRSRDEITGVTCKTAKNCKPVAPNPVQRTDRSQAGEGSGAPIARAWPPERGKWGGLESSLKGTA